MSALKLHTSNLRYGDRCGICKKVAKVLLIQVRTEPEGLEVGKLQLCYPCIQDNSFVTDVELPKEDNPIKRRQAQQRIKDSRKLEAEVAKDMGGKTQAGSGGTRIKGCKGDIRKMGQWLLEHKFTDSVKSWRLLLGDLAKIVSLATEAGEWPGLIIDFRTAREAFAIIPYALFLELVHASDNDQESQARKRSRRP
jgi:hypothetical protein